VDEAGEARVKRMALDGAEERARPRRGPCTLDSPTQCTSPELSLHRHTGSLYFNDYRTSRRRDEFCKRASYPVCYKFFDVDLKLHRRLYNFNAKKSFYY